MRLNISGISLALASTFISLVAADNAIGFLIRQSQSSLPRRIAQRELRQSIISESSNLKNSGYFPPFYPKSTRAFATQEGFYPVGTLPTTKTYYCDEGYGLVTYTSDSFGLRNNDAIWNIENIRNKKQIVLIGDSFVQGACVKTKFTIGNQISDSSKHNVISIGMGDNGPTEYISAIKSVLAPIKEISNEEVYGILLIYPNDNEVTNKHYLNLALNAKPIVLYDKSLDKTRVIPSAEYIAALTNSINNINFDSGAQQKQFIDLFKLRTIRLLVKKAVKEKENYSNDSLTAYALKQLDSTCKKQCTPIVVFLPNSDYWARDPRANRFKNHVLAISQDLEINFLDLSGSLGSIDLKNSNYAPKGAHYSPSGYQLISSNILKFINEIEKEN